jgi:hypothetical protein
MLDNVNVHGFINVVLGQFKHRIKNAHLSNDTKDDALAFARVLMLV